MSVFTKEEIFRSDEAGGRLLPSVRNGAEVQAERETTRKERSKAVFAFILCKGCLNICTV
jgi:hypothetical protein